ncbi:MAG: CopD family protein [Geminicoccaceae bacterium]
MWVAALLLQLAAPAAAVAHAVLLESMPADGDSLSAAPVELSLRFSEPVRPVAVRLLDAQAREVPGSAVHAEDERVVIRPASPLAAGGYYLSYRVTSLDAHAVGGIVRFGIDSPAPGAAVVDTSDRPWAAVVARWLFYVTAMGAVGASLFGLHVDPRSANAQRLASICAMAGLVAIVVRLGASGLELSGAAPAALLWPAPWLVAVTTSLGSASAVAAIGLGVLGLGGRLPAWAGLLGAVAVAGSFALTGHAATAEPRWLTGPVLAAHVLIAGFWLGALPLLWLALRDDTGRAAGMLRRFSALALPGVALLVLAGATMAWIQLGGSPAALTDTSYGARLLVKLALVASMLALAAANRWKLVPALAAGRGAWLSATLAAEMLLGLGVLAVTATFPLSPPPRAAAQENSSITVIASGRGGQATLSLVPGRAGSYRLEAGVADPDGVPIAAREAIIVWSAPTLGIEPLRLAATMPLPGVVVADGLPRPRAGRWRLRLDLLIDDFTKLTFEGDLDVP